MMDLHSIGFSSVFVRFCISIKSMLFLPAFLKVHIRTNQNASYWTKVFRKNIFVKGYSFLLKYRSHRSCINFFDKIFINKNSLLSAEKEF